MAPWEIWMRPDVFGHKAINKNGELSGRWETYLVRFSLGKSGLYVAHFLYEPGSGPMGWKSGPFQWTIHTDPETHRERWKGQGREFVGYL